MASRSWEARLTLKGPVVDIDFCGANEDDDDDEGYDGQECVRRSRSEPNLQTHSRSHNFFAQVFVTIDPYSNPIAKACFDVAPSKYNKSECNASMMTFGQRPSKEEEKDDHSQAPVKLEGVAIKKNDDSLHSKDWDDDGDTDALDSSEGHLSSVNAGTKSNRPKKARPCKGQRIRQQKLEARLMSEIRERPELFDVDGMTLPLSFSGPRRKNIVSKLQAYKHNVLREREIESILRPLLQDSHPIGGANMTQGNDCSMVSRCVMCNSSAIVQSNKVQDPYQFGGALLAYDMGYSVIPRASMPISLACVPTDKA